MMKTQLLGNGYPSLPSLPVQLGFPMPTQPSLDSLPASFSSLQLFSPKLFHTSNSLCMGHPPLVTSYISLCTCPRLPKTHLCTGSCWAGACVLRCGLHYQLKETKVRSPVMRGSPRTKATSLNESGNRPVLTGPILTASFHSLPSSFNIVQVRTKAKVFLFFTKYSFHRN